MKFDLKTLYSPLHQEIYSTVRNFVSSGVICENINPDVFVMSTINIRWSGFWVSTYSKYQKFISDKIISCRSNNWTFKRIADWFNDNGFQTPRGKVFSDRHVHGILKKRKARDDRFFRDPVVTIMETDLFYGIDD